MANGNGTPQSQPQHRSSPELLNALDDLCSRFLINCPEEEYESLERICFQIEQAHWFYEDFYRENNPRLPAFSLKEFARIIFQHCALLQPMAHAQSMDQILTNFKKYKFRVPVFGAIILNPTMDKCLLVKGWHSRSSWGFPKGKINKDEPEIECAAREVYEETGFNIRDFVREEDHIEVTVKEQRVKLYIVPGVPEDTPFAPRTRKEISKIDWHNIADLPTSSAKDVNHQKHTSNLFLVSPFIGKLRSWIREKQRANKRQNTESTRTGRRKKGQMQQVAASVQVSTSPSPVSQQEHQPEESSSISDQTPDQDLRMSQEFSPHLPHNIPPMMHNPPPMPFGHLPPLGYPYFGHGQSPAPFMIPYGLHNLPFHHPGNRPPLPSQLNPYPSLPSVTSGQNLLHLLDKSRRIEESSIPRPPSASHHLPWSQANSAPSFPPALPPAPSQQQRFPKFRFDRVRLEEPLAALT